MKQIKIKAWDETRNIMCDVVALDWDNDGNIISAHLKQKDSQVYKVYPNNDYGDKIVFLEYTGLKDKNKKEIYKGNIVKFSDRLTKLKDIVGYVGFMNGSFIIKNQTINHYRWIDYEVEVIGNIYENKDLLED